jgi:hypothetical protein
MEIVSLLSSFKTLLRVAITGLYIYIVYDVIINTFIYLMYI